MKSSLTIKSRLFFAFAAILAFSYAVLFFCSLATIQSFIEEESAKNLQYSLKFAKTEFNSRPELVLEALKLTSSSRTVQEMFLKRDQAGLLNTLKTWTKSLDFLEMLTVLNSQLEVIARSSGGKAPESFTRAELSRKVIERKQAFTTTEIVSHEEYCREVSREVCHSLPENRDVMVQLVYLPVLDVNGSVIGVMIAGDDVNKDPHLPYQQQQVFGKTVDMFVTQKEDMVASTMTEEGWFNSSLETKVVQALKNGFSFQGASVLNNRPYDIIAEPLHNHKGEFIGSIAVALETSRFAAIRRDNFRNLIICGLLSSGLIFVLAYLTATQFAAPIRKFAEAAKAIEAGDYSIKVAETGSREFRSFAEIFNRMTLALSERDSIIQQQNLELATLNKELEKSSRQRDLQLNDQTSLERSIVNSLLDGLVVADDGFRIISLNPVAEKLFGTTVAAATGKPLQRLTEELGLCELTRLLENDGGDKAAKAEAVVILNHNFRRLRFSVTNLRDSNGAGKGILLGIRDVTADFEVDRLKSGFIAKISHELKTPLTSMKGSLEFVLKKGKWLTGVEREMLGVCHRNTDRLITLIASILELSRIEAGQILFAMRPQQIGEIVLYAIEEIKGAALKKNISVVNDVPMDLPRIKGDYERLTQVLFNLLSNAVKFSPEDSVVTLSAAREKSFISISVADGADVIPEEQRGSLFSRFQQMGRPEDGEFSGNGLGLAISKEIIERHGGSVIHTPGAAGGNVFTIKVPLYGEVDANQNTYCG